MKYFIKPGIRGLFHIDDDNNFGVNDYIPSGIDWVYQVDQDGTLTVDTGDEMKQYDVTKDDFVIVFYRKPGLKSPVIIIHNDEWNDNLSALSITNLGNRCDKCEDC